MIIKMKNNWKKQMKSNGGFTLVELIVVLVIMSVLTAITVPAMTGWIDRAKQKQADINARTLYLAARTITAESYAQDEWKELEAENGGEITITNESGQSESAEGAIASLAGIQENYSAEIMIRNGEVVGMHYQAENGFQVWIGESSESDS